MLLEPLASRVLLGSLREFLLGMSCELLASDVAGFIFCGDESGKVRGAAELETGTVLGVEVAKTMSMNGLLQNPI